MTRTLLLIFLYVLVITLWDIFVNIGTTNQKTKRTFTHNLVNENASPFFEKIGGKEDMLLLPDVITSDLLGVVNAIEHHIGINKFLFHLKADNLRKHQIL